MSKDKETIKQGVQTVVQRIYESRGHVAPSMLVIAAKPPTSPAHEAFEWDDNKAGDEYRLIQARQWLRVVRVVKEDQPEQLVHVPKFLPDENRDPNERSTKEGFYKPPSDIVQNPNEFQLALAEVEKTLRAAQRSLDDLYKAAGKTGKTSEAAVIAQMSMLTQAWTKALSAMH